MITKPARVELARFDRTHDPGPVTPTRITLLQLFWRRKWSIVAVTVICTGLAYAYCRHVTPMYASESRIYVQQSGPKILPTIDVNPYVIANGDSYLYIQQQLIKSPKTLEPAINQPGIRDLATFQGVADPLAKLQGLLTVDLDNRYDVLTITCEAPNPDDAATLTNAVVAAYKDAQAEERALVNTDVIERLEKIRKTQEDELKSQQGTIADFQKANSDNSFDDGKDNVVVDKELELNRESLAAERESSDLQRLDADLIACRGDPTKIQMVITTESAVPVPESGEVTYLKDAIQADEMKLATMQNAMSGNTAKINLENSIRDLQSKLDAAVQQQARDEVAVVHQRYLSAQEKQRSLEKETAEARTKVAALNSNTATYRMLSEQEKQLEKSLADVTDRIEELKRASDTGSLNINVLTEALPNVEPAEPQTAKTTAAAGVIGLTLGVCCALMLEWMDRSVHTVEELKSALPVHVLGTIPRMRGGRSAALVGRIAQVDPRSDVAEAYRMIRTAIHFGMPRGQGAKVLVTSPHPGDGKTVTTSNLAIAMAQAGHRTLLIDADFRRPMQHVLYGIETEVGASSAAAGVVSPESVIRASGIDRLDILPCGEIPANPAGLLNSQQFANMIAKLSLKYDYLLIDSPPVIPVTDARILSAMCDSTILVLRAGKSTRKDCEQAVEALAAVGARSVGVLLNDLPARSGQYHYGDYNYTPRIDAGNQLTLESAGPATATAGNGNGNGNGKRTKWNQEEH